MDGKTGVKLRTHGPPNWLGIRGVYVKHVHWEDENRSKVFRSLKMTTLRRFDFENSIKDHELV